MQSFLSNTLKPISGKSKNAPLKWGRKSSFSYPIFQSSTGWHSTTLWQWTVPRHSHIPCRAMSPTLVLMTSEGIPPPQHRSIVWGKTAFLVSLDIREYIYRFFFSHLLVGINQTFLFWYWLWWYHPMLLHVFTLYTSSILDKR